MLWGQTHVSSKLNNLQNNDINSLSFVSLIKRYKDRYFPAGLKPQVRRLLSDALLTVRQEEAGEVEKGTVSEPPQKVPRAGSLHAMYAELLAEDEEQNEGLNGGGSGDTNSRAAEINLYLSEAVIPNSDGQPLAFWRANKDRFPGLAQAAWVFLSAPCTSVDSERLFSSAGHNLDEMKKQVNSQKCIDADIYQGKSSTDVA